MDEKKNRITSAQCHTRKQDSAKIREQITQKLGKEKRKKKCPSWRKGIRHQLIQEPTRRKNFQVLSTIKRTRLNMGEKGN